MKTIASSLIALLIFASTTYADPSFDVAVIVTDADGKSQTYSVPSMIGTDFTIPVFTPDLGLILIKGSPYSDGDSGANPPTKIEVDFTLPSSPNRAESGSQYPVQIFNAIFPYISQRKFTIFKTPLYFIDLHFSKTEK